MRIVTLVSGATVPAWKPDEVGRSEFVLYRTFKTEILQLSGVF